MKELTCYDCDTVFSSETSKDMLAQLYTHYMAQHKAIITGVNEQEKQAWMKRFTVDWDSAKKV